jgi:enamine deaminase RidA (YjgF/YER057c/UK114 family)
MSSVTMKSFNPEGHPPLAPSYSHISTVPLSSTKKLVTFAGQTGTTSSTNAENAPKFSDQVQAALSNVDKCLSASGAEKKDIISIRQYVVKLLDLSDEDRKARVAMFLDWWKGSEGDRNPPPSTLIGVDSLVTRETLYEIEISCVVDS